jgi:hypothetical protein
MFVTRTYANVALNVAVNEKPNILQQFCAAEIHKLIGK